MAKPRNAGAFFVVEIRSGTVLDQYVTENEEDN